MIDSLFLSPTGDNRQKISEAMGNFNKTCHITSLGKGIFFHRNKGSSFLQNGDTFTFTVYLVFWYMYNNKFRKHCIT